jgi:hypothetical protein
MKQQRITFALLMLLLEAGAAAAAGKFEHEASASFNMHRSSLAPVAAEDNRWGLGGGGGVGYSLRFTPSLSFRTGLHANYYRGVAGASSVSESSDHAFPDWWWGGASVSPNTFTLSKTIGSYLAQHSALYFQLPLLVELEPGFLDSKALRWYAAGGFKVGYALSGSSDADVKGVTSTAVSHFEDATLDVMMLYFGFGDELNENVKGKLDLGFHTAACLEVGFKQQLTDKYFLYVGIFGEYNLYSAVGSGASTMLEYEMLPVSLEEVESGADAYRLRYHPSANVAGNRVRHLYPLSFGVTVRIGFVFKKPPPEAIPSFIF